MQVEQASTAARWLGYGSVLLPAMVLILLAYWTLRTHRSPNGIRRPARWVIGSTLAFLLMDWGLFTALPLLELSFGPVPPALFLMATLRLLLCVFLLLAHGLAQIRRARASTAPHSVGGLVLLWLLSLGILVGMVDTLYIEPFALRVTEIDMTVPALSTEKPLRILHITDPHIERTTKREREALSLATSLEPDLIVLTGDYLNLGYLGDPTAHRDTRDFLAQLHAPMGVYAVNGTVDSSERMQLLFDGLDIVVLDDEIARLEGSNLYILGVSNPNWGQAWERDKSALRKMMGQIPEGAYTLLLFHTPDLIEVAAEEGVDLYLAGHTHGGQIRLPFYGALFTGSRYDKQYEAGLYTLGPTSLYVSRGLGMEGFVISPRVRFLCPPEIVLFNLQPGGTK